MTCAPVGAVMNRKTKPTSAVSPHRRARRAEVDQPGEEERGGAERRGLRRGVHPVVDVGQADEAEGADGEEETADDDERCDDGRVEWCSFDDVSLDDVLADGDGADEADDREDEADASRRSPRLVRIAKRTAMATTFVPMVSSATTRSGMVGPAMTR